MRTLSDAPRRVLRLLLRPITLMSRSNTELVAEVFPGVPVTRDLGENETLLSIEKARRVLGYSPQHSWC